MASTTTVRGVRVCVLHTYTCLRPFIGQLWRSSSCLRVPNHVWSLLYAKPALSAHFCSMPDAVCSFSCLQGGHQAACECPIMGGGGHQAACECPITGGVWVLQ
eukprot:1149633-Pelagomonas_calceolata.AAC.7